MLTGYMYELWDGRRVVGHYKSSYPIYGVVPVYTVSQLKEIYGKRYEVIKVPIIYRTIYDNGIDITRRTCLDVRRKSKRQIAIITGKKK